MRRRTVIGGLAAHWLLPVGGARAAASLGVAPTVIDIATGETNSVLFVSNSGVEPLTAQLRLFAWRNEGGEEKYTPSADIGFSPGQFGVPPGGRQVVRLALLVPGGPVERAYRLVVDQLPVKNSSAPVNMAVRMIVPVFAAPSTPAPRTPPVLAWSGSVDRESRIATLSVSNPGMRRVRLSQLGYSPGGSFIGLYEGLAGYVLAAGRWSCRFRLVGEPATITVEALTDGGKITATVALTYG